MSFLEGMDQNQIILIICAGVLILFAVLACIFMWATSEKAFPRKNGMLLGRVVTDFACGTCFLICFVLMVLILVYSFFRGDPRRLTHGTDWNGRMCGIDAGVTDKPFLYFCGSAERSGTNIGFPKYIMQGSHACVSACPTDSSVKIECLYPAFHNFTVYTSASRLGNPTRGMVNVETLDLTVTQSLVKQDSYPTEKFGGKFCVPDSKKNLALHETVVDGPFARHIRPMLAFGGLRDAWVLLSMAAGLSLICSYIYFQSLKRCAGLVIFSSMVFAALLLASLGAMMLWVVFVDPNDPPKLYGRINPVFSVYTGLEAKCYSIIAGTILMMMCGIISVLAATSMSHIDEMVGLIDAALECTNSNTVFAFSYPLFQSGVMIFMVFYMIEALTYVSSLSEKDSARIKVDGQSIPGLQVLWVKTWKDNTMITFYLICCWWILEIYFQWANFIIAYVVSNWYFHPLLDPEGTETLDKGLQQLSAQGTGKHVNVRVGGVDQNYGPREGVVMHDPRGQRMLVVPVGKKAPGLGRYSIGPQKVYSKGSTNMSDIKWIFGANAAIFTKHLGSIALGAPVIAILRPFRLFSQCLSGFLNRNSVDPMRGQYDSHPGNANIKGCFALFSACLDQVVGKYCKNAYVELVLAGGHSGGGGGFFEAADESFKFLVTCGGSVAYLHGAMLAYEAIGCICITAFCGWGVLIVQDKVDWFNEPNSGWYIEDKNWSAFAACVVAFVVSYSYMALWNQTADVLLYCVAWNRRQVHLAHEFDIHTSELRKQNFMPYQVVPNNLRYLIPEYELDPHYEEGVHAHGVGQMGAIIAAMEHGAMNKHSQAGPMGPNISGPMGSVFQTGARMGNF